MQTLSGYYSLEPSILTCSTTLVCDPLKDERYLYLPSQPFLDSRSYMIVISCYVPLSCITSQAMASNGNIVSIFAWVVQILIHSCDSLILRRISYLVPKSNCLTNWPATTSINGHHGSPLLRSRTCADRGVYACFNILCYTSLILCGLSNNN